MGPRKLLWKQQRCKYFCYWKRLSSCLIKSSWGLARNDGELKTTISNRQYARYVNHLHHRWSHIPVALPFVRISSCFNPKRRLLGTATNWNWYNCSAKHFQWGKGCHYRLIFYHSYSLGFTLQDLSLNWTVLAFISSARIICGYFSPTYVSTDVFFGTQIGSDSKKWKSRQKIL